MMKERFKGRRIGKGIVFVLIAGTVFTALVMYLWNWLMPEIFGLTSITFWQALGLLVLSKILFGGGKRPGWKKGGMSEKRKEYFMKRFQTNDQSQGKNNESETDSE